MTIVDDVSNIRDMVYISGTHKRMMTIGDMSNIKDTILDLWHTQAWIAMIIDDTSNIKDVI